MSEPEDLRGKAHAMLCRANETEHPVLKRLLLDIASRYVEMAAKAPNRNDQGLTDGT
jgi:hypothetical protein